MSNDKNHRTTLALAAGLVGLVALTATATSPTAWGQGSGCASQPAQAPGTGLPTAVTASAWVDPVNGEDATGVVRVGTPSPSAPSSPFLTIQAAANAVASVLTTGPQTAGIVNLLPGRYGYSATDPDDFNGEVWPVTVPPHVSLRGVNALGVMLDGSAVAPGAQPVTVPDPQSGLPTAVLPVLRFGGNVLGSYEATAVSHLTIHDAAIGILVDGPGTASPTVANVCVTHCQIGVRIHAAGLPTEGLHRPRLWHCTVANNANGVVVTGETVVPGQFDSRPVPTIVNTLLKNQQDFEGVACQDVVSSAFDPARVNGMPLITQPLMAPALPAFDASAYSYEDLFLGARYVDLSAGAGPAGPLFTDLRLTFRTATLPTVPNPALVGGHAIWPLQADNGTLIDITFPFGPLGWRDGEGNGSPGTTNPNNPSGTGIGYDLGGVFHVGGSAPITNRFGQSTTGVVFNAIDAVFRDGYTPVWLFGNFGAIPSYVPGRLSANGILDVDQSAFVQGLAGGFALDPTLQLIDLSFLLSGLTPTNPTTTLPVDLTTIPSELVINLQAVGLDAQGQWRISEPQSAYIDPTGLNGI